MAIQFPALSGPGAQTPFPTLSQLERQQTRLFGQLASGNQLTSASVNPAGVAIAAQLTTQVNGFAQAVNNIGDAQNMVATADAALGSQQDVLQQERVLAVQSGDAALTDSQRQIIQGQIAQLNAGFDQTAQTTSFNGIALVSQQQTVQFQSGANAGQTTPATLPQSTTNQLGLQGVDLTTQATQPAALGTLDQAIATTSANRADLGAAENNLQSQGNNAATSQENALAARSQLADTNMAEASAALSSTLLRQTLSLYSIQQQSATFALTSRLLQL